MKRRSVGTMVGATILALVFGAIQPFTVALSMLVMITPVVLCTLYFWAGLLPALVCAVSSLASLELTYGAGFMWGGFVTMIIPAAVGIYLLRSRRGYFTSMQITAGTQLFTLVVVAACLYLTSGKSLVDLFIARYREWLEAMNPALSDLVLAQSSALGLVSDKVYKAVQAGEALTEELRTSAMEELFSKLEYSFKLGLPAMMLTSSLLTGVLAVALPTRICVRRGDEPEYSYVPLTEWFIPGKTTMGLLCALITCLILELIDVPGADSVNAAFSSVVYLLCALQGMAAVARALKARGWTRGKRAAVLALLYLFATDALRLIGAASALFGRQGAISGWIKKYRDTHDKED